MWVIRDRQNGRVKFAVVAIVMAAVRSGLVTVGVVAILLRRRSIVGLISLDRLVFGGLDSGSSVGGRLCDGGRHLWLGRLGLGGCVGHFFCGELENGKVKGGSERSMLGQLNRGCGRWRPVRGECDSPPR